MSGMSGDGGMWRRQRQRHAGAALWALLVLLVLAAAVRGAPPMDEDMAELAQMLHDNCGEETGADLDVVARVNAGEDLPAEPPRALKCYVKCVMETAGMMSEGAVDVEAALALLPPELAARNAAGLRACATPPGGADDCDTAYLAQLCWQRSNKKDYFLI